MLCNLYLCPNKYVVKVFNKIKNNSDNERFDTFIKYYEEYYINLYNYKRWNFFDNPSIQLIILEKFITIKLMDYLKLNLLF